MENRGEWNNKRRKSKVTGSWNDSLGGKLMREAMYQQKKENHNVRCLLCPHHCTISPGNVGRCRVRGNVDGTLYAKNYGKVISYAYDPIEKKPLYLFYPGSTIFSIGTFGCNLACDFCQNAELVYYDEEADEISDEDIIELARRENSIGIAYTYNESTIWYEYVLHVAKIARKTGLKNILVTNGYINEEPLCELLPYIDAMNIDLKSMETKFYEDICKGSLEPVLNTIELSSQYTHVEVTTLVIEGENSKFSNIEAVAQKIASIDPSIPLHLSRYHPAYKMKLPPTPIDTLVQAVDISKKYLDYVYMGNVLGADQTTYCKICGNPLILRDHHTSVVGIKDKKCNACKNAIQGLII